MPAPASQRVPTAWGEGCRHCARYQRACGRHEDLTLVVDRWFTVSWTDDDGDTCETRMR